VARRASGEGTIKKRFVKRPDGTTYKRFFARVTINHKTIDGPWRKTQEEAKKDKAALVQKYRHGYQSDGKQTLNDYALKWLEQVQMNNSYKTYVEYHRDLIMHVLPILGSKKLDMIKRSDCQDAITQIYKGFRDRGKDGRAATRKCRATLRVCLQAAQDSGILEINPCLRIKVPSEASDPPELWTPEEAKRFLEVARASSIYPAIYLSLSSGLRQGELLALKWDSIEFYLSDAIIPELIGRIYVAHSLKKVSPQHVAEVKKRQDMTHLIDGYFLSTPKTKKSKGFVSIPSDAVEVLLVHRFNQQLKPTRLNFGLVFPSSLGKPLSTQTLTDAFHALIDNAKVPRIKWHGLRHTHATYLIYQGVDIATVSARLRHSTPYTTLNRYVHAVKKVQEKAAMSLGDLFKT
jgi:integrase